MKFIGFIVVALVVLLNVSTDEAMKAQVEYCDLVELYESQDDIEPHLRDGHPNYNKVDCERVKNKSGVE